MNQIRVFLVIAWMMVAMLLWLEWSKEQTPDTAPLQTTADAVDAGDVDGGTPSQVPGATVPNAGGSVPGTGATPTTAQVGASADNSRAPVSVTLANDVLQLQVDGGSVRRATLMRYRETSKPGAQQVTLFNDSAERFYVAQSGWTSAQGAPGHVRGFVPEQAATRLVLADGAKEVSANFIWEGAGGVRIRRTYTLARGSYAVRVRDEVINRGTQPWTGHIYREVLRVPPRIEAGMTNPESFTFNGAAWYSPEEKYEKRKYEDFIDDGEINRAITGGWIGLQQHYFFAGWVPQPDQAALYNLINRGTRFGMSAAGPEFTVAPGANVSTQATLWVGPKLPEQLSKTATGLDLTLDYGIFTIIAEPIQWLLGKLHGLTANWGWAIVLLVLLIKLALYPLSAAQYKSMAKMRKFMPRIQQLKERYGEDKQKFQMAYMELLKKEKLNPAGGCLPMLIQMPVFLALYWVLIESVDLRQASWILWYTDLTARDPYFILPIINMAVMWYTQRLTPMAGMDPIQQRMFQFMPLVFGVMFAFFPAGLVLYWVTNGTLGLIQQVWMMRIYGDKTEKK